MSVTLLGATRRMAVLTVAVVLATGYEQARAQDPDFDADGKVDIADFFILADAFGKLATGTYAQIDLNADGWIRFEDFFLFADAYGRGVDVTHSFWPLQLGNSWTYSVDVANSDWPEPNYTLTLTPQMLTRMDGNVYWQPGLLGMDGLLLRMDASGNVLRRDTDGREYLYLAFTVTESYDGREEQYLREHGLWEIASLLTPIPAGIEGPAEHQTRRFIAWGGGANYVYQFEEGVGPVAASEIQTNHPHSRYFTLVEARIWGTTVARPPSGN